MSETYSEGLDTQEKLAADILDGLGINTNPYEGEYMQKVLALQSDLQAQASQEVLRSFSVVVNQRLLRAQNPNAHISSQTIERLKQWQSWLAARSKK